MVTDNGAVWESRRSMSGIDHVGRWERRKVVNSAASGGTQMITLVLVPVRVEIKFGSH